MNEEQLKEIRRKAELAVADMTDDQLRVKAFGVILSHLLTTKSQPLQAHLKVPKDGANSDHPKVTASATTLSARILSLKDEQFFSEMRTIGEIREELAAHGWHYPLSNLSGKLQGLARLRALRRMKASDGGRVVWKYSTP